MTSTRELADKVVRSFLYSAGPDFTTDDFNYLSTRLAEHFEQYGRDRWNAAIDSCMDICEQHELDWLEADRPMHAGSICADIRALKDKVRS